MHWYKIICSSSQIVQNHNIISHYYFVHSFKVEDVLRFRQFSSQTTFNKSKVVDDVPQLINYMKRCFWSWLRMFCCNYFDLSTILISEEVYSWLPKISYIRNLKKFPQERICFCYCPRNAEMLTKISLPP